MTSRIGGPKPPATGTIGAGGPVVRPMYGVFIRDNLARFRTEIGVTIADTKKALNTKGELSAAESNKAKAAVDHLQSAMAALKPVFASLGAAKTPTTGAVRADMGRGGTGGVVPMYGVVFRDDLSRFRNEINSNVRDIQAAINNGQLKGPEKAEAQKALGYLKAALRDVGATPNPWE